MARSSRRQPSGGDSFAAFLAGFKRSEFRRGAEWTVQPVSAAQAQKPYTCPGCGGPIAVGIAHVVVWRADGILGDAADLAARRHWHTHCWKVY
ncbi:hypothetical protein PU630_08665 [Microbacterium horticulturae]|uniref:ATP/GTP-binding protein n=1 Tax=Microbacterium horticulturae TaxID=3028316 RepID=A0ABY8C4F7_9MICO|nr:hypothetical protein [Microbacterium sp. KACC 23027]WEG10592.1 hypothetical protein PU630_08665 [Microbacterium sp. KACC 23027]